MLVLKTSITILNRDVLKVAGPTTTFSWTGVTECIQESLAMAAAEQWFVKCESKYSAEELAR